jgi:hypothetical protein
MGQWSLVHVRNMNRNGSDKWRLEMPTLKLVIEFGPLPTEERIVFIQLRPCFKASLEVYHEWRDELSKQYPQM